MTIVNPSTNEASFKLGLCRTLLIAIVSWLALSKRTSFPPLCVILNVVFTPSKELFKVWDVPDPATPDILTTWLLFAFANVEASLIVSLVSKETKYTVPLVNPPIFAPPPWL